MSNPDGTRKYVSPMLQPNNGYYNTRSVAEVVEDIQATKAVYLDRARHLAEGTLNVEEYRLIETTWKNLQYELTRAIGEAGIEREAIENLLASDSHIPEMTEEDFLTFLHSEVCDEHGPRTIAVVAAELAVHEVMDRHLRGLPSEVFKGKTERAFYLNADKVARLQAELKHLRAVELAEATEGETKIHFSPTVLFGQQPRRSNYKPSMGTSNRKH